MFQANGKAQAQQTETLSNEALERGYEKRSVSEAYDEVVRELEVRQRVYGRWVRDGKLTETDAKDRMQRLIVAAIWMGRLKDVDPMFRQELERAANESEPSSKPETAQEDK
jgi:hypothetical protein